MSEKPKPLYMRFLEVSNSSMDSEVEISLDSYEAYITIFLKMDEVRELHQWLSDHIDHHE